ncbi:hypothetical protein GCM10027436_48100 [Actinophytocola sediminis]
MDSRAFANARNTSRCWDGPFGAVRPFDAPSWLTADPRTTANTRCPLRRASDNRSNTNIPTPSDQPVPSAPAENALHRPSTDNPRCRENSTKTSGVDITVTPPANANPQSPNRNDCAARCNVTNDEEHAVSTVTAGPSKPKV